MLTEQIAFVVVLCAALAPLLVCSGKLVMRPTAAKRAMILLWISMPAAIGLVAAGWRAPLLTTPDPPDRPLQQRGDGYVGSDSCRVCHAEAYARWHDSYHRTMTQAASPAVVIGDFANVEQGRHRLLPLVARWRRVLGRYA